MGAGNWKDMVKWNPLQKVYLYRDEESAAEDMAFILFQIWNFPVDSPLYVKAASFPYRATALNTASGLIETILFRGA